MTPEENTSNFNGFILEIVGKGLIKHTYSDTTNQHHIVIGIPQIDEAERQVKCSQYDSDGNSVKEIDLTAYKSINIVEVSQQPTTTQQSADSINKEAALSRNQEHLSSFYQSYQNEDSSIDWSKMANKITLLNTSGSFYDHDNKYIVGFKIECSPQGVESIEFRDDAGKTLATLSASQLSAKMVIGNPCPVCDEPPQGTFCSPLFSALSHLQVAAAPIWSQCSQCGVLFDTAKLASACFGNPSSSGNPPYGCHSPIGSPIYLPYDQNPTQYDDNLLDIENIGGGGLACEKCGMLVLNKSLSPSNPSPPTHCPYNNGHHTWDHYTNVYWVQTEPVVGGTSAGWQTCSVCSGLFNTNNAIQACYESTIGNLKPHTKVSLDEEAYQVTTQ